MYQPQTKNQVQKGVYKTKIDGLFYLDRHSFADKRGFFAEIAYTHVIEQITGKPFQVKQINHSVSLANVVRGMHAEDWKKLATVTSGICFSALADVRPKSSTFGQVETFKLGFGQGALTGSLFINESIANSICVIKGPVSYVYCVDRLYKQRNPKGDIAISVFDPDLNINWPIPKNKMILSKRDQDTTTLRKLYPKQFKS